MHGEGVKEHDEHLYAVLNRIRECGLTLNGKKCQFRLPKLTFFWHDLSRSGVQPSEEKVAAIRNAEPPQNASEVRSFLVVEVLARLCGSRRTVAKIDEDRLALCVGNSAARLFRETKRVDI